MMTIGAKAPLMLSLSKHGKFALDVSSVLRPFDWLRAQDERVAI
jgi:hypothetical protein